MNPSLPFAHETEQYPEHLAKFLFSVCTGLRLGSQYAATYENINWDTNTLTTPRTKNDTAVHTPLNATVLVALRTLPSWKECEGPIFRNLRHPNEPVLSNDYWFIPALETASVTGYRWHDNRQTFASRLIQDGVTLGAGQQAIGPQVASHDHVVRASGAQSVARSRRQAGRE